jgi:alpha-pyrone synthase
MATIMQTYITAIATANPPFKRAQSEAAIFIANAMKLEGKEKTRLLRLFANSGINYRYSVLGDYTKSMGEFYFFPNNENFEPFPTTADRMAIYKTEAIKLAMRAATQCIAKLDPLPLTAITHLITVSCTGMYTPGLDIELVQQLELNPHTERTAINFMGCYGAFNGIKVAKAICQANPCANVLLVCVELCSLHFQKNPIMDNVIANVLFGDGAAAAIIQGEKKVSQALELENFYCDIIPDSNKDMAWHIGDYGFEMALSAYVPNIIKSGINKFILRLLSHQNYTLADIDFFAIHPGGKKILEAFEKALEIPKSANRHAYTILKNYGNMSSTTILFVLSELLSDINKKDHHKKVMSMGFGPGLTLESMLLRIHND